MQLLYSIYYEHDYGTRTSRFVFVIVCGISHLPVCIVRIHPPREVHGRSCGKWRKGGKKRVKPQSAKSTLPPPFTGFVLTIFTHFRRFGHKPTPRFCARFLRVGPADAAALLEFSAFHGITD